MKLSMRSLELQREESGRRLDEYNHTSRDIPCVGLHQLVEAQSLRTPDAVAASCGAVSLTYRKLNERANRLARELRAAGIGPESRVAITNCRSLDTLIGLLAILKAGGAYVPIDPDQPLERLQFMLEDVQPDVMLCPASVAEALGSYVRLAMPFKELGSEEEAIPAVVTGEPANIAYILYTSGSTGMPKGVLVPHRALVNLLCWARDEFQLHCGESLLGVTTFCFDTAGVDLWLPLICGARVVIATREMCTDGRALAQTLAAEKITFLQATPATWRLLLDAEWTGSPDLRAVCTGEAMPRDLLARLLSRTGRLWNMYGPTETTIWSTAYEFRTADAPILIGRPIANTQVYVLDEALNPVPERTVGELYIGGAGLASGYVRRPSLTQERFPESPFRPGERIYRTGDLARYAQGGNLECLGRTDHQIKVNGFRIEPGEIEFALAQHAGVREVLVTARDVNDGQRILVAYVVAREVAPSETELRNFVHAKLPEYMRPAMYLFLPRLPLNANGKVDRNALPVPDRVTPLNTLPPLDTLQFRILKIWERVLGHRTIGIDENFFDIGGDSLRASKLLVRIEQDMGLALPMSALFEAPTVESLAAAVRWSSGIIQRRIFAIQPAGRKPPFFCMGAGPRFRSLALGLGTDQPFFGFPMPPRDSLSSTSTLADIGAYCLESIEAMQPDGPYYLGGWSNGGILAYEIAQQMRHKGSEVGLLALFDAENPVWLQQANKHRAGGGRISGLARWSRLQVRNLAGRSAADALRNVSDGLHYRAMCFRARFARKQSGIHCSDDPYAIVQELIDNYKPAPFDGPVMLFQRGIRLRGYPGDEHYGWSDLVPNLEVHEMAGDHMDMFLEPAVHELAKNLRGRLDENPSRVVAFQPVSSEEQIESETRIPFRA
jgi:amino acid adenylation domain-containing protein